MSDEQTQGVNTQTEDTTPAQGGGESGGQPVQPEVGEAQSSESETQSENSSEESGENPETPTEPAEGNGEAPAEAGNVQPENSVQPENEPEETQPTGEDESQGTQVPGEPRRATDEEKAELKSLQFKRTQTTVSGDEVARMEELSALNHDN